MVADPGVERGDAAHRCVQILEKLPGDERGHQAGPMIRAAGACPGFSASRSNARGVL
jgi:hypothetical protein